MRTLKFLCYNVNITMINNNLLLEWDYDKNGEYNSKTHKTISTIVSWICIKNPKHKWKTAIKERQRGTGCPYCKGKKVLPEDSLGAKYPEITLQIHDKEIDSFALSPFSNKKLKFQCQTCKSHWCSKIVNRTKGKTRCPYCFGNNKILREKSLGFLYPKIASQIVDPNIDPFELGPKSSLILEWKCPLNHFYKAKVADKIGHINNCLCCSNHKVAIGFNDLLSQNPKLAKEWDYNKNCLLRPENITLGSDKKIWWKCHKGHSWQASPNSRKVNKCRQCSKKGYSKNEKNIFELLQKALNLIPEKNIFWNATIPNSNKRYRPDIRIESKKIIIEYNGDYHHCNPNKYKSNYYNQLNKKTAQEIWDYDKERIKFFESIGYRVITIWESDWKNKSITLDDLISLI